LPHRQSNSTESTPQERLSSASIHVVYHPPHLVHLKRFRRCVYFICSICIHTYFRCNPPIHVCYLYYYFQGSLPRFSLTPLPVFTFSIWDMHMYKTLMCFSVHVLPVVLTFTETTSELFCLSDCDIGVEEYPTSVASHPWYTWALVCPIKSTHTNSCLVIRLVPKGLTPYLINKNREGVLRRRATCT